MESLPLITVSESYLLHSGRKRKSERLGGLAGLTQEAEPGHQLVWPSGPLRPTAQQEATPHCEVPVETLYYAKQVSQVRPATF